VTTDDEVATDEGVIGVVTAVVTEDCNGSVALVERPTVTPALDAHAAASDAPAARTNTTRRLDLAALTAQS